MSYFCTDKLTKHLIIMKKVVLFLAAASLVSMVACKSAPKQEVVAEEPQTEQVAPADSTATEAPAETPAETPAK